MPSIPLTSFFSQYQNLTMVLDSLTEAIIAHGIDRRIIYFNKAAQKLTGLSREQALGKDCRAVIQGGFCGHRCSFCVETPLDFDPFGFPLTITDTAGQRHQVEMVLVPMRDENGVVQGAVAAARDITELSELRRRLGQEQSFAGIVGAHHTMLAIARLIQQVAPTDVSVLIEGESGTGKELVAAAIHSESLRKDGPMVAVSCAALPEGLLESELFGHVRGAFTGAHRDKRGRFELASGGTLFLDEVGELPHSTQVKLLRVLQEQQFERVGGETPIKVDVRVVCATNRDLAAMVKEGRFREDLYFRLAVVPLRLPPLRERRTDILLIAEHLLSRAAQRNQRPVPILREDTARLLLELPWPGNIRQLDNALQYAALTSGSKLIAPEHLPRELRQAEPRANEPLRPGRRSVLNAEQVERALGEAGGNKAKAARLLGVGRATLYRYFETSVSK
jgi:PAS domain S-box-containing protein